MLKLQELREAKGWSRAELGRRADSDGGTVGKIENGRYIPPLDSVVLVRIALALNIRGSHKTLLEEVS